MGTLNVITLSGLMLFYLSQKYGLLLTISPIKYTLVISCIIRADQVNKHIFVCSAFHRWLFLSFYTSITILILFTNSLSMTFADFAISRSDLLQTMRMGTALLWKTGSERTLKRYSVESAIVFATLEASTTYKTARADDLYFCLENKQYNSRASFKD